jgi:hypothetical protein
MSSKAEKIRELTELLNSGALSKDEYEFLKKEIILGATESSQFDNEARSGSGDSNGKRKVVLKQFLAPEGEVNAPQINYLDFANITAYERNVLSAFLAKKQMYAHDEMTEDENELYELLFSEDASVELDTTKGPRKTVKVYLSFLILFVFAVGLNRIYTNNVFEIKDKIHEQFNSQGQTNENTDNSREEVVRGKNNNGIVSHSCSICDREFVGRGYEEVADGIWQPCQEPYQCFICSRSCGLKHTQKMNSLIRSLENQNQSSGNSCGLCKGTGIERGRDIVTGETVGRICPMCDGKGVITY